MVVPESPIGVVYVVHGPAEPGMQLLEAASLPASPLVPVLPLLPLLHPPRAVPASNRTGR
jgi:hypothetical protein